MKRNIILLFVMLVSANLFAQKAEIKPDPRLYDCFTKEFINKLMQEPQLLAFYNYYLDHSYFVSNGAKEKPVQGTDISEVTVADNVIGVVGTKFNENIENFDVKKFNPLKYNFKVQADTYTNYLLGKTGKVLVFYPSNEFSRMFKEYYKSLNLE